MDVLIQAGEKLEGKINIPPSKSYGQRALAASLLVSRSKISNLGKSADELVALQVIRACGSKLTSLENGAVEIETRFDFTIQPSRIDDFSFCAGIIHFLK